MFCLEIALNTHKFIILKQPCILNFYVKGLANLKYICLLSFRWSRGDFDGEAFILKFNLCVNIFDKIPLRTTNPTLTKI